MSPRRDRIPPLAGRAGSGFRSEGNFAFIDAQNVHRGVQAPGWELDWRRFRVHLRQRYAVGKAYLFLGYLSGNEPLYDSLHRAGYTIVFKPVVPMGNGRWKGNIDAEMVLQAMIDLEAYEQAVLITSDGDFSCLARHLRVHGKLRAVVSPCRKKCSTLLQQSAEGLIGYLDEIRHLVEHHKEQGAPRRPL